VAGDSNDNPEGNIMQVKDQLGLAGKTVLVLGGGQGNGAATCHRFADAGANVAIVDLDIGLAEKVAGEVRERGVKAVALTGDVRKPAECARLIEEATRHIGVPDCLITIIGQATMKPILDLTPEDIERDLDINLRFFVYSAQAFARALIAAGKPGTIAGLSSVDGIFGSPVHAAYGFAKAGLINFIKSAATEWADHGIRVNCVAPGAIVTPRVPDSDDRRRVMKNSMIPLRRSGQPPEIAGALLFLSSDLSSYVTGQTLPVDGGWTAGNYFDAGRDTTGMIMDNGKKF
jgi:NAD(P)-dependent dehydrogenase (short-subunit alcohol dehydrogenase family)